MRPPFPDIEEAPFAGLFAFGSLAALEASVGQAPEQRPIGFQREIVEGRGRSQREPSERRMLVVANDRRAPPGRDGVEVISRVCRYGIGDLLDSSIGLRGDVDFFLQFAAKRLFEGFSSFEVAAGKAPAIGVGTPRRAAPGQQHMAVAQQKGVYDLPHVAVVDPEVIVAQYSPSARTIAQAARKFLRYARPALPCASCPAMGSSVSQQTGGATWAC